MAAPGAGLQPGTTGPRRPGVTTHELGTAEAPLYRYDGLRLLTVSGERYFFLHEGWSVEEGTVVVLPDDASLRVQYGR